MPEFTNCQITSAKDDKEYDLDIDFLLKRGSGETHKTIEFDKSVCAVGRYVIIA